MLLLLNCNLAQGFVIAKPMPADALTDWLDHFQPPQPWLDLAAETLSPAQRALRLWSLITSRWLSQLQECANHNSQVVTLPVLDAEQCHCGNYLTQIRQQRLLEADFLNTLTQMHHQLHEKALALKAALENDSPDLADHLRSVNMAGQELQDILAQYA